MSAAHRLPQLLLLADGRMPSGGHANGGGTEWAARHDDLADPAQLEAWVRARLETVGVVDAAFAVAARGGGRSQLDTLDIELTARLPGERARIISRQLGRQFVRSARRTWPSPAYDALTSADGAHFALAIGCTCGVLDATPEETATVAFHHLIAGTTTAAVRILGIDPVDVAVIHARLAEHAQHLAALAPEWATAVPSELPATSSALAGALAEDHGTWSSRLFVA